MILRLTVLVILFSFTQIVIAEDLNQLYQKNYDGFWEAWEKERINFESCSSPNNSVKFLLNTLETSGNAEVSEANSEVIEKAIINNPKCVLDALLALPEKKLMRIMDLFIARPLYHPIDEIQTSFETIWNDQKYATIKSEFIRLK